MRYVTTAEMREIDQQVLKTTFRFPDVPESDHLVKIAAQGIVNQVLTLCGEQMVRPPVVVVFGNGFNGADALYAGWELAEHGFRVTFFAAMDEPDAKGIVKRLTYAAQGFPITWLREVDPWTGLPPMMLTPGTIIIDGILGTGLHGAPREPMAAAIRWINRHKGRARILSVDIPSGLDADSGTASGDVVEADCTVTMGLPKTGLAQPSALRWTGSIDVNNLAMPDDLRKGERDPSRDEMVTELDVAGWIPKRGWDAHKGDLGHVCVIGGAPGFGGAPALAARGALRAGAGLVSVFAPACVAASVSAQFPEAMVYALKTETVSAFALELTRFDFKGKTLVVGPGLSQEQTVKEAVSWLLTYQQPSGVIVDADALNVLSKDLTPLADFKGEKMITPHPGEAARLLGVTVTDVQADRAHALRKLVERTGSVVILKGAGTLVSAPGRGMHLVPGVNPGMARGGMGDVLAGIAGALLARGLPAFEAACAAAWLHVRAGDVLAWRYGREAMLAADVADLPVWECRTPLREKTRGNSL